MPSHRRLAAGLLGLLLPGCYEGFDPLDPEVLAEIARSRGDAQGLTLSGVYRGALDPVECGCDEYEAVRELSLCFLADLVAMFGQTDYFPLMLVQADGTVQIQVEAQNQVVGGTLDLNPTLYGPLGADGHLAAAGVLRANGIIADGQILARLDGTLTEPDDGGSTVLEAEYRQRYLVDVLAGGQDFVDLGDPSVLESVDCREQIDLELTWIGPLPEPEVDNGE